MKRFLKGGTIMSGENKNIELTKEQLDEVSGGVGGKDGGRKDGDLDHVRCPNCGAKNEIPTTRTIICIKCGTEFEP